MADKEIYELEIEIENRDVDKTQKSCVPWTSCCSKPSAAPGFWAKRESNLPSRWTTVFLPPPVKSATR
ncbi:hypothetical protein HMSSN036_06810 [Paenibacillus macerans]|nr:hypothetical protein HMSSN036_06810 [Paenibacillus macerans]